MLTERVGCGARLGGVVSLHDWFVERVAAMPRLDVTMGEYRAGTGSIPDDSPYSPLVGEAVLAWAESNGGRAPDPAHVDMAFFSALSFCDKVFVKPDRRN